MRYLYGMGDKVLGPYGFYDAFSETEDWYPKRYLAIDQGPIAVMIENYRSGLLWKLFMSHPDVQQGLRKLGFQLSSDTPYFRFITGIAILLNAIAASTALYIIIADGTGGFLDAGFQLADTVTDTDAEALAAVLAPALLRKTNTFERIGIVHVLLKEVAGKSREGQTLVEERLVLRSSRNRSNCSLTL